MGTAELGSAFPQAGRAQEFSLSFNISHLKFPDPSVCSPLGKGRSQRRAWGPRAEVWGSPQELQLGTMQKLYIKVHLLPPKAIKSTPKNEWIQKDKHRVTGVQSEPESPQGAGPPDSGGCDCFTSLPW